MVYSKRKIQGDHSGLWLDFVDFHSRVPPVCPFAMQSLPNLHLPKQNWANRGTNQIKVNKTKCQTTMDTQDCKCAWSDSKWKSSRFQLTWDLGSGPRRIFTRSPVDPRYSVHSVRFGRWGRQGWLQVDQGGNWNSIEKNLAWVLVWKATWVLAWDSLN